MNSIRMMPIFAIAILLIATASHGALIASYNFDGNLDNSAGASFSPLTVVGASPDISGNSYHADGNPNNYLEVAPAVGGSPTFTVSVWVWTNTPNQGNFKGIFSNNDSNIDDFSWQMDSHAGQYRVNSINSGVDVFGDAIGGRWQNLVLQKTGGNSGALWLDGVLTVANIGANPGGLQEFRIGINRNSDNAFTGLIDRVEIWDTVEDPAAIFAAGPGANAIVPEPATGLLGLLGLAALGVRRRRCEG